MGLSLAYNSLGSTFPFPVSVLYELLARSRIMSSLPHILYLFYKESYERLLLSFDYILFKWIYPFLSVLFCFLVFCKWFSFLQNLIFDHVFIQAAVAVVWLQFFLPSSVEETGFTAHLLNWTQKYFVAWWWLLTGKRNFRNVDWQNHLIYASFLKCWQISLCYSFCHSLTFLHCTASSANYMWRHFQEARR